jgi:hypothetical protein
MDIIQTQASFIHRRLISNLNHLLRITRPIWRPSVQTLMVITRTRRGRFMCSIRNIMRCSITRRSLGTTSHSLGSNRGLLIFHSQAWAGPCSHTIDTPCTRTNCLCHIQEVCQRPHKHPLKWLLQHMPQVSQQDKLQVLQLEALHIHANQLDKCSTRQVSSVRQEAGLVYRQPFGKMREHYAFK